MRQFQTTVQIPTGPHDLTNVTERVQEAVRASGLTMGLCTLFLRHTSASLIIQENADPDVLKDLENFMKKLVREDEAWSHTDEGLDDMPSHVRTALTHTSEQIPITQGRLALGTWQGVYLWEHRAKPHTRQLVIHIVGE